MLPEVGRRVTYRSLRSGTAYGVIVAIHIVKQIYYARVVRDDGLVEDVPVTALYQL
ncbi:hypothetical protein K439DRAFT_1629130 [Ramaria rubella]|nr:hypothetical protein K439DRAFT_1629130 [Ramaria rubella]